MCIKDAKVHRSHAAISIAARNPPLSLARVAAIYLPLNSRERISIIELPIDKCKEKKAMGNREHLHDTR
jgi:hypothetical protein